MNKDENLEKEIDQVINSREKYCLENFPKIRRAYNEHYDWPELDVIRHEVCLCLFFGLYQAAITLSNHFLETLLKLSLVYQEHQKISKSDQATKGNRVINILVERLKQSMRKYNTASLHDNINRSCRLGLITKDEKKQLHEFRERLRNAFSHSDKSKMFGETEIPVQSLKFEDNSIELEEPREIELALFPVVQSVFQVELAKQIALDYFLYLDRLARKILKNLFSPEEDS